MIPIIIPTLDEQAARKTGHLAQQTAGCDTRLIVVVDAKGTGFSKTINVGLRQTTTEDVCILNDDIEWFLPAWLEILRRALYSQPHYGIAGPSGRSSTSPMRHGWVGSHGIQVADHLPFWCVLIKREVFNRVGYLEESFIHYGSDNIMCWEAAKKGQVCIWVKDVFLKHTHHGSGMQQEWKDLDDLTMQRRRIRR